jgi:hypothetical protein
MDKTESRGFIVPDFNISAQNFLSYPSHGPMASDVPLEEHFRKVKKQILDVQSLLEELEKGRYVV